VAFWRGGPDLACVQAALNFFNTDENVLTRMFTLEYSAWFDLMLPAMDRLRLAIPLVVPRTTSAPRRCERSAVGTPTTSPRTPTWASAARLWACGWP
jgi:hypothetical protein